MEKINHITEFLFTIVEI